MRFRSDLEALILAVLDSGPGHGYEIASRIGEFGEGELRVSEGLLYPALHRLEQGGLLEATWVPQAGKPDRRVYRLTESGSKELESRRKSWTAFRRSVDRLMTGERDHA